MDGLHHRNPEVVELVVGFHYGSSRMVKLEVELYHECSSSNQKTFQSGEASDGASPQKS